MVKNLFQRVADEACPPAVLGRRMCGSSRLDKWGFESPTQFLVVAIPAQAEPELNSLVNKSDGKVYGAFIANHEVFDQFGRDGMRLVESAPGRGQKAFLYEWSRTMLETLPPYPEED